MAFFEINGAEVPIAFGSQEDAEELVGGTVTTITGQRRRRVRARLRLFSIRTAELTGVEMADLLDELRGPGTLNITGDWINAVCFADVGVEGPVQGDAGFFTLEFRLLEVGGVVGPQLPEDPEAQIELEQELAALNSGLSTVQASTAVLTGDVGFNNDQLLYNVKRFGAVGNGSTDDTTAFRNAVNSVPSGAVLHIPEGTYRLTGTIPIANPISVLGERNAVLDVRLPVDSEEELFDIVASDVTFVGLTFDASSSPAGTLTIRHRYLVVGQAAGGPYTNIHIDRCKFLNLNRKGVHNTGSTGDESTLSEFGVYLNNVQNARVTNCLFTQVSAAAIFATKVFGGWFENNRITMLDASDSLYPINVDDESSFVWVRGNHITGGERASGGAVNIMSSTGEPVCEAIFVEGNLIEDCAGFGSGAAVIRVLSVVSGAVRGNIVRAIPDNHGGTTQMYINVNARTVLPAQQPGPIGIVVAENVLVCGAPNARAINIDNDNTDGDGGEDIQVLDNLCLTDGVNIFEGGIRVSECQRVRVAGNLIHHLRSDTVSDPNGITVSGVDHQVIEPVIEANDVFCNTHAQERGIYILGDVVRPVVRGNRVRDATQFGLRIDNTVSNPIIDANVFVNCGTAISNLATGASIRHGNVLAPTSERSGTWQIASGTNSVTVNTAEVQTLSRITLTVVGDTGNEVPVRVAAITGGVSFRIETMDGANAGGNFGGTWEIDH